MVSRSLMGGVALVFATASASFAADGAAVFQAQCAKCHGETGKSDTSIGKAMKVPPLAGDAKVQAMSEADVEARIKGNEKHPPTVKSLKAEDVTAVAAHVKALAAK